jgi:hypothetical protein
MRGSRWYHGWSYGTAQVRLPIRRYSTNKRRHLRHTILTSHGVRSSQSGAFNGRETAFSMEEISAEWEARNQVGQAIGGCRALPAHPPNRWTIFLGVSESPWKLKSEIRPNRVRASRPIGGTDVFFLRPAQKFFLSRESQSWNLAGPVYDSYWLGVGLGRLAGVGELQESLYDSCLGPTTGH